MIIDAFKIAVWLIERYQLQEQIINHINTEKNRDEAVMIEPYTNYIIHFEKPFITRQELLDKIVSATQPNDEHVIKPSKDITITAVDKNENKTQ